MRGWLGISPTILWKCWYFNIVHGISRDTSNHNIIVWVCPNMVDLLRFWLSWSDNADEPSNSWILYPAFRQDRISRNATIPDIRRNHRQMNWEITRIITSKCWYHQEILGGHQQTNWNGNNKLAVMIWLAASCLNRGYKSNVHVHLFEFLTVDHCHDPGPRWTWVWIPFCAW